MFFTFRQNNSGGFFTGPAINVIVEADDHEQANNIAEENGVYFRGCSTGQDCNCCGDRWSSAWQTDGTEEPEIWGNVVENSMAETDGVRDVLIVRKS